MTNKTAAARYARALFDVALHEKADFDQIERELSQFADLFTQFPELARVLLNPAVPVPRKRAAIGDLLTRLAPNPILGKLLAMLAERDRLVLVPDLLVAYRDRLMTHRHVVRAEVTTASPLPPDRTAAIEQSLAQVTGRRVLLNTRVDAGIIGGMIAKVGSTVYDASVTRQLQKMKERLVEGT